MEQTFGVQDFVPIQIKENEGRGEASTLVSIDERLILRKVKGVCCGGVEHTLVKQLPFVHFANFRKVRSCRAITRFDDAAMRFLRSFLTGSMIKRSPSVRTSSSVSRSIPNSSRIGFSINNPRLFPTAESFFRMRYPVLTNV